MQREFPKFCEKLRKVLPWWKDRIWGMEKLQEHLAILEYKILESSKWDQDVELSLINHFSRLCGVVSMQTGCCFFPCQICTCPSLICLGQSKVYSETSFVRNLFWICIWCHFELRTYSILVNFGGTREQLQFRILFGLNLRLHREALKDLHSTSLTYNIHFTHSWLLAPSWMGFAFSFLSSFQHLLFLCVILLKKNSGQGESLTYPLSFPTPFQFHG